MSPSELLEHIRLHYLERLQKAMLDHRGEGLVSVETEAILREKDGSIMRRGNPPTGLRVDLVTVVAGRLRDTMMVDPETMPAFEPFTLEWEHTMPVRVNPFPWHACPLRIKTTATDFSPLATWFDKWFDPEDAKPPEETGLLGVVHGLMTMPPENGDVRYDVDFGSAPLEAFEELLDTLRSIGATSVDIGFPPPPGGVSSADPA